MTNAHDTNVNVLVGELVHQHMWRDKITQTSMAGILGIGQPAVARKLRGERPFTIDELLAVAACLDRPITDLLPNGEQPHPGAPSGASASAPSRARTGDNPIKSRELYQLSYRGGQDDTQRPEQPAAEADNHRPADYKVQVLTFPARRNAGPALPDEVAA